MQNQMKQLFIEKFVFGVILIAIGILYDMRQYLMLFKYSMALGIILSVMSIIAYLQYSKKNTIKTYNIEVLKNIIYNNSINMFYLLIPSLFFLTYFKERGNYIELTPSLLLYLYGLVSIGTFLQYIIAIKKH